MNLNSEEDIEKFEEYLKEYEELLSGKHLKHLSLLNIYELVKDDDTNGGKIITAFLDIKLNFSHIYRDVICIRKVWNSNFAKGKLDGGSFLDSQIHFNKKMDIHYTFTSFVLRYRAIWDKIMGLILLLIAPIEEYERYAKAKSRKKEFKKAIDRIEADPEFSDRLLKKLEKFDSDFRTAEAHGTGVLRKYVFKIESIKDNPQSELLEDYWNFLNETIFDIGEMIKKQCSDNAI